MNTDLGIDEVAKNEVAYGLNGVLGETFTLYVKTLGFHWNVTGAGFYSAHKMFEDQYRALFEQVDELAERLRALGYAAPGTPSQLMGYRIEEQENVLEQEEMLAELEVGYETLAKAIRNLVPTAQRAADEATLDLLTEHIRDHEKTAWMLRATVDGLKSAVLLPSSRNGEAKPLWRANA